jgi:prophage antirepressor-like protein
MDDQNIQATASQTGGLPVEFKFENHTVRTISKHDEIWFVAADVCAVLEINNPRQAISRLDNDEKGVISNDTNGGPQDLNAINESGLYSLIFTSRKPESKKFRKWVTNEVLPAIRKTGRYEAAQQPALDRSRRGFEEILVGEFIDPDALLQILFGEKIPFSGHEKFRFLAGATCAALGLRDPAAALDLLPKSEQAMVTIYTPHGPKQLPAITEPAMYYLAFKPRNRPDVMDCARTASDPVITKPFSGADYLNRFNLRLLAMLTTKLNLCWHQFLPRHPELDGYDPFLENFESTLRAALDLAVHYVEPDSDP